MVRIVMTQRNMLSTCRGTHGTVWKLARNLKTRQNSSATVLFRATAAPRRQGISWNLSLKVLKCATGYHVVGVNDGHLLRSRLDNGHTPTATWGRGAQESVRRRDSLERSRLAMVELLDGASVPTPTTRDLYVLVTMEQFYMTRKSIDLIKEVIVSV